MKRNKFSQKVVEGFKRKLYEEEKSAVTIDKYARDASGFCRYLNGRKLSRQELIDYKSSLLKSGLSARSVNSKISSLNSFLNYIGQTEYKMKNLKVQKKVFCPEEKELTKDEYARLCNAANKNKNERLNLILQTICSAGIRVGELEYITVEAVNAGIARVSCKAKTRDVFIVKQLQKKLLAYIARKGIQSGSVFITKGGKPIDRTNVWRDMKNLCKDANVMPTKVFPHNLRHLFARIFYGIEKDIVKLADILGHSNINTTRIYVISTGVEHRRRVENMRLIM